MWIANTIDRDDRVALTHHASILRANFFDTWRQRVHSEHLYAKHKDRIHRLQDRRLRSSRFEQWRHQCALKRNHRRWMTRHDLLTVGLRWDHWKVALRKLQDVDRHYQKSAKRRYVRLWRSNAKRNQHLTSLERTHQSHKTNTSKETVIRLWRSQHRYRLLTTKRRKAVKNARFCSWRKRYQLVAQQFQGIAVVCFMYSME